MIFGPLLTVKNINIIKKDDITNINIAYKAIESIRGNRIFTLDRDTILKKLTNYQQNITDIELKIKFPNTLIIHIESSKGVFNTTINKKQYIITRKGTLIPKKHSNELRTIDILYNFNENVFLDYKDIFQETYIGRINSTIKGLEENIIDLKIKNIQYYPIEREMHIILGNNTQLLFSIHTDTNKQIKKTAIFNREHIKLNDASLIYMDLRIKNKVFYCTSEDEYICNQNLKKIYAK
ncbi:hypothetical protein A9Q91_00865 [Candidatus Gracilibacteria bacterium 28_42_T64]|nr:hypothetical protein A9Q91_00865 [Candidatus Gracilibacteria bacterium 28_42_T64]